MEGPSLQVTRKLEKQLLFCPLVPPRCPFEGRSIVLKVQLSFGSPVNGATGGAFRFRLFVFGKVPNGLAKGVVSTMESD